MGTLQYINSLCSQKWLHCYVLSGKKNKNKYIFLIWRDYEWFEKKFTQHWEGEIFQIWGVVKDLNYVGQ